jgi:hypothetical protein
MEGLTKLAELLEKTSVWPVASVEDEPETLLSSWRVFEVDFPEGTTRHLNGYCGGGRVCSAIQEFDPKTRRARTKSGRIYELVGNKSGYNSDANYVWSRWLGINKDFTAVREVSEEYEVK